MKKNFFKNEEQLELKDRTYKSIKDNTLDINEDTSVKDEEVDLGKLSFSPEEILELKEDRKEEQDFPRLNLSSSLGKRELKRLNRQQDSSFSERIGLKNLYSKEAMESFFAQTKKDRTKESFIIPSNIHFSYGERFILKRDWRLLITAFCIPFFVLLVILGLQGFYPFGSISFLPSNSLRQYVPLLAEYQNKIKNLDSLIYSFNGGLGHNFFGQYSYYLASPFNFLLFLFPASRLHLGIFFISLLKIATASVSMALYLRSAWCFSVKEQMERYLQQEDLSQVEKRSLQEKIFGNFLHKNDYQNTGVLVCSLLYALNAYVFAYLWQWLWLDALIWTPLVLLGIHRLVNLGRPLLYIFSLGMAIFSQYYSGVFVLIFSCIYFVAYLIINRYGYTEDGKKTKSFILIRIFQYILANGLTFLSLAFFLLPIWGGLQNTYVVQESKFLTTELNSFNPLISWSDLLGIFVIGSKNLATVKAPSIYASLLPVLALPLYFACDNIKKREKLVLTSILLFILISFSTNIFNQFWHLFHLPQQLFYRFSYLYIFISLVILFRVLSNLRNINFLKGLLLAPLPLVLFLLFYLSSTYEKVEMNGLWLSFNIAFSILYIVLFLVFAFPRFNLRSSQLAVLLSIILIIEIVVASFPVFKEIKENESFLKQQEVEIGQHNILPLVKQLKKNESDFYRMAIYPSHSLNDPSLYQYPGISIFSSTMSQGQANWFAKLGYFSNEINSVQNAQMSPLMDLLWGVKYHLRGKNLGQDFTLKKVYNEEILPLEKQAQNEFYERKNNLSLAYPIAKDEKDFVFKSSSVFQNQTDFINYLTGLKDSYYYNLEYKIEDIENLSYKKKDALYISTQGPETMQMSLVLKAKKSGQVYLHISGLASTSWEIERENIDDSTTEKSNDPLESNNLVDSIKNTNNSLTSTPLFASKLPLLTEVRVENNYFLDLGFLKEGGEVRLKMKVVGEVPFSYLGRIQNPEIVRVEAKTLDLDNYESLYKKLKKNELQVKERESDFFVGQLKLEEAGDYILTLPYDEGWHFSLNGELIKPTSLANQFFRFSLPAGTHTLVATYHLPYLKIGMMYSLGAFVLILLFLYLSQIIHRYMLKKNS